MSLLHVFWTFSGWKAWKRFVQIFYQVLLIILWFYRVLFRVLWEITISSNWVYFRDFRLNFEGLWGVGKGFPHQFKGINLEI